MSDLHSAHAEAWLTFTLGLPATSLVLQDCVKVACDLCYSEHLTTYVDSWRQNLTVITKEENSSDYMGTFTLGVNVILNYEISRPMKSAKA